MTYFTGIDVSLRSVSIGISPLRLTNACSAGPKGEKRDPHRDDSTTMPTTQRQPAVDKRARSEKRSSVSWICSASGDICANDVVWLLLIAAVVFGVLAIDAARLSTPAAEVPYSLTAKSWGEDVAHISLAEQEQRKQYNARFGLGDVSQAVWLFGILSASCLAWAAYLFCV